MSALAIGNFSPTEMVLARLDGVVRHSVGWRAECPVCGDHCATLWVAALGDLHGAVALKCLAGCQAADVVGAVGLSLANFARESVTPKQGSSVDRYPKPIKRGHAAVWKSEGVMALMEEFELAGSAK